MTITSTNVIAIAPEYASPFSTGTIDTFIGFAELQVFSDVWGRLADMATTYLAAHLLALSYPGGTPTGASSGPGGPLTSEKVGDVSRNFGQSNPTGLTVGDVDLMSTGYGRQFLSLRESLAIVPTVSAGSCVGYAFPQWPFSNGWPY